MKKKVLSVALCAAMVASMTACGGGDSKPAATEAPKAEAAAPAAEEKKDGAEAAAAGDVANDPKVTLVYAEVNPVETTIVGQMAAKFKEIVEEKSGGSIEIDLQAAGVLGAEGDYCDDMMGGVGTIDIARLSASTLTGYGVPKTALLCIPYAFTSREQFWNFAYSDTATEILQEPSEQGIGVRGLFFGEEGFRHIFTSKPVEDINGLKGLKIRVSTDPTMTNTMNCLATATVVSYSELYSSLQSGVVDGAENPINNYKANAFYEVAPYLLLTGHQLGVAEVVITDMAWDKLTEGQQAVIMDACREVQAFNKEIVVAGEQDALDWLKTEGGVTVTDVPDKTPYVEACAGVIADATKGYEDLWTAIQNY